MFGHRHFLSVFIFCIIDLLIDAKQTKPGSMVIVLDCADRRRIIISKNPRKIMPFLAAHSDKTS